MQIVYLIQGSSTLVESMIELLGGHRKMLCLTYDVPLKNQSALSIFDSGCSWAEGRNKLLKTCLSHYPDFDYVVFLDDDVKFSEGSFIQFEAALQRFKPDVAIPIMNKNSLFARLAKRFDIKLPEVSLIHFIDEQFQAFHSSVVSDWGYKEFYCTKFDDLSWWYSCDIMQAIIRSRFNNRAIQVNSVTVLNEVHGDYPKDYQVDLIASIISEGGYGQYFQYTKYERQFAGSMLIKILRSWHLVIEAYKTFFFKRLFSDR